MAKKIRLAKGRSLNPKKRDYTSTRTYLIGQILSREIRSDALEYHGQTFAVGLEPNYYKRSNGYERRIVYCHTGQATWATRSKPYHRCDMYGGRASWTRCSACPDNWGFGALRSDTYPRPVVCVKSTKPGRFVRREGDFKYESSNPRCRACSERALCVGQNITTHKHITLDSGRRTVRLLLVE